MDQNDINCIIAGMPAGDLYMLHTLEDDVIWWAQYQKNCNPVNIIGKQHAEARMLCLLLAIHILFNLEETYDLT